MCIDMKQMEREGRLPQGVALVMVGLGQALRPNQDIVDHPETHQGPF